MAAPPVLGILTAGGFGCRAEGERLIVHPAGDLTDALRVMIRASKADLLAYLHGAANDPAPILAPEMDPTPRHSWWLCDGDGTRTVSFTPRVTEAEVRALYPAALVLPDDDVSPEV